MGQGILNSKNITEKEINLTGNGESAQAISKTGAPPRPVLRKAINIFM
jgi:hypothetical protein